VLAPLCSGGRVRIMSPSGDSILITSAPRSANRRVQCGPGRPDKVKEDRRLSGANLAVIVSIALPDGIIEFDRRACAPGRRSLWPCASN
jgi:hypothetical protein